MRSVVVTCGARKASNCIVRKLALKVLSSSFCPSFYRWHMCAWNSLFFLIASSCLSFCQALIYNIADFFVFGLIAIKLTASVFLCHRHTFDTRRRSETGMRRESAKWTFSFCFRLSPIIFIWVYSGGFQLIFLAFASYSRLHILHWLNIVVDQPYW